MSIGPVEAGEVAAEELLSWEEGKLYFEKWEEEVEAVESRRSWRREGSDEEVVIGKGLAVVGLVCNIIPS